MTRLKDVALIIAGQSPASSDVYPLAEGQPFIQGNAEFGTAHPTPLYECLVAAKNCQAGDILLSVRAPVGAVNVADQAYGIGRGLCAIQPHSADRRYVAWWLQDAKGVLNALATGSTFAAVSAATVGALELPLTDITAQRAIADYLDRETARVDSLIEEQHRLIGTLRERRSSVIGEATTKGLAGDALVDSGVEWIGQVPGNWAVKALRRCGTFLTGSTPPTADRSHFAEEPNERPWVRPQDLAAETRASAWLTPDGWRHLRPVPAGSVLVGCIAYSLGSVGHLLVEGTTNQQITSIVPTEDGRYLYYVMCAAKDELWAASQINRVPILNNQRLGSIQVPVPPRKEQRAIAEYLDEQTATIDVLIAETERFIELSRERRAALITAAVTGQIDVLHEVA